MPHNTGCMHVFQFLTVRTPDATARLVRLGAQPAVSTILDLEDGLWDPLDEARTDELKESGREHLVELAGNHAGVLARGSLGVRINRITGSHGHRDIEALGRAAGHVRFDHVVATKVERGADLVEVAAALRAAGVGFGTIVPIVETRAGIAALDDILEEGLRLGVRWLVFGFFDFALDSGWWPFPDPADPAYWTPLVPVIAATEAAGIGHVHAPFFALEDDAAFERLAGRLAATCRLPFGMISIGRRQTALAARLAAGIGGPSAGAGDADVEAAPGGVLGTDPRGLAAGIVAVYAANRRADVSFVLDPDTGNFISPHLYLAARAYLARLTDD